LDNDINGFAQVGAANFSLLEVVNSVTLAGSGNITTTDPQLGPLAENGGPTKTHALLVSSPAIDSGNPAAVAGIGSVPLNDQRRVPFGRVYGSQIDIGAIESKPIPSSIVGDYNQNTIVDAADYILWRKTLNQPVAPYSGSDGNGNATIDQDDYGVWRAHFGHAAPASGIGAQGTQWNIEGAMAESISFRPSPIKSELALAPTFVVESLCDDALVAWLNLKDCGRRNSDSEMDAYTEQGPGSGDDLLDASSSCDAAFDEFLVASF